MSSADKRSQAAFCDISEIKVTQIYLKTLRGNAVSRREFPDLSRRSRPEFGLTDRR